MGKSNKNNNNRNNNGGGANCDEDDCWFPCGVFKRYRLCQSWIIPAILFFIPIFWGLIVICCCNPNLFDYSSYYGGGAYGAPVARSQQVDYGVGTGLYRLLNRPWWAPSTFCYIAAWIIVYLLIGATATILFLRWQCFCRRCNTECARRALIALVLFYIQFFFNIFWLAALFCLGTLWGGALLGFIAVLISAVALFYFFYVSRLAFWLYVPYFVWQTFVLVLNVELAARN